ncbi:MAG: arginine--tRNA ligase [Candidatus Paceibacterota bacterium]|jgi:arginyl-tRNA synthetase
MKEKIKNLIRDALGKLTMEEVDFIIEHPDDLANGDFSSNVAMVCAKNVKINPKELAEKIKVEIEKNLPEEIVKVEAISGFLNFYLSRNYFVKSVEEILNKAGNFGKNDLLEGKRIMVEYTDPNPFKPIHIGHLMTYAIGESIVRILENSGAKVSRANYQGDVGLHVAKAIYGLLQNEKLQSRAGSVGSQAGNIGRAYSLGAEAYEFDEKTKKEIDELNTKIYKRSDEKINEIYRWGFDVTMEAFEDLYKTLGTRFDFYFLESAMADIGREIVENNMGKIFEESDNAIVFKAEKYDPKLHTRVFVTTAGLPTYETKELGLTTEKFKTNPEMDLSITITANEQMDYMRVVTKAISLIFPELENKMKHITHGMMRLASGKMGSRKGNVITGEALLDEVRDTVLDKITDRGFSPEEEEKVANDVGVAAIKYSILKQSIGGDIIFDFDKSISFEGDSGPYLQYSYTRANSVLEKAQKENIIPDFENVPEEIFELEKLLYKFPRIAMRAASEYEPHYVANHLVEIARSFNSFYGNNLIVSKDDQYSPYKVALTYAFSFVMKNGLHLLGIEAPRKM